MTSIALRLAVILALGALGALAPGCASGEIDADAGGFCQPGTPGCGPRGGSGAGGADGAGGRGGSGDAGLPSDDAGRPDRGPDAGLVADSAVSGPDAAPPPSEVDFDRDGVPSPRDCDDRDARRNPEAPELPGDQLDSNCDGQDDLPCAGHDDCPPAHFCQFPEGTCQFGCRSSDCRAGLRCHTLDRACVPNDGACARDEDCVDGVCGLSQIPGTEAVNGLCRVPLGESPGGAACRESEECQTGFCVYGQYCLALCRDGADCGADTACGWIRVRVRETESAVRTCLGVMRGCQRTVDCRDDEQCLPIPGQNALRGYRLACVPSERPGPGLSGAPCQAGDTCQSGVCLDEGLCFGLCVGSDDCHPGTRCYSPGVFIVDDGSSDTPSDDVVVGLSTCLPDMGSGTDCSDGARCPEGEYCGVGRSVNGNRFVPRCLTALGPKRAGSRCGADAECQSGSCDRERCLGVCAADAECADGTRCIVGRYVFDTRGTADRHDDGFGEFGLCIP